MLKLALAVLGLGLVPELGLGLEWTEEVGLSKGVQQRAALREEETHPSTPGKPRCCPKPPGLQKPRLETRTQRRAGLERDTPPAPRAAPALTASRQ